MQKNTKKSKLTKEEKQIIRNLDRINRESEKLFKEDKILLKLLRKEINEQQRRAS